jgi:hypothetical protein
MPFASVKKIIAFDMDFHIPQTPIYLNFIKKIKGFEHPRHPPSPPPRPQN